MPEASPTAALETYVLLANGAKGAAAVGLIQQVLDAPGVYVFGELLDHPNIKDLALENDDGTVVANGKAYHSLLNVFAYGTFADYVDGKNQLPPLTEPMKKKLRLLTVATMATKEKTIRYDHLQKVLAIGSVRELEDLIIEGANNGVLRGKLDQKSLHFEVDYAMGRDMRREDIGNIVNTLQHWCESCDGMLACLEEQVVRANSMKQNHTTHKVQIDRKVSEIRGHLKAQQQLSDAPDDPDSRMETDRRDKKSTKGKGLRGSGKTAFWHK